MLDKDLISRKALVKALLEERDKYPPIPEERYTFGAKKPHLFNQAVRAGIRKALRAVETAPGKQPSKVIVPIVKRGRWIEFGERGFHGKYFWETPLLRCSRCFRTPPAHEQEHHDQGGTTVSVHWHKTNCCPHCGAVLLTPNTEKNQEGNDGSQDNQVSE